MSRFLWLVLVLAALALGCGDSEQPAPGPVDSKPPGPKLIVEGKKVDVGKNIWVEFLPDKSRRVIIAAFVCLRRGPLELVLTRKKTKEHEAIFAAEVDARKIHEALLLTGVKDGKPTQFVPAFSLPKGGRVAVHVQYVDTNGEKRIIPAGRWVRNIKNGKELDTTWVFGGSQLVPDPRGMGGNFYLANDGDLISVVNVESAILDVPFASSKSDEDLGFEAWEERIPAEGTEVFIVLTPVK